ncbi:MAG: SDR family NAD(P)-dependent oxidoreductase [Gammaproteobacteria bacterium]|nr:SDR family NAD(P)-dependent oxidoreductase [Gammaproteobacteria bacterium]
MDTRTCLITGSASGMGKIAARELALQGAKLILVDREIEEGRAARDEIAALSNNDKLEFIGCDVSSFAEVRTLAEHVDSNYDGLHILINNAGLTDPEYKLSADGHEQHMATMHLGHYLLTHLLLDKLKASAPARIIQISSDAHKAGKGLDFDDMKCEKVWKGRRYSNNGAFVAYHRAKLAMVCCTYDMARKLERTGVTINAVSPGYFIKTNVYRHVRGVFKLGVWLMGPFMTDPERAAKTYVFLATSPDVDGISGKYWEYCKQKASSPLSHDEDLQRRVREYSVAATGVG